MITKVTKGQRLRLTGDGIDEADKAFIYIAMEDSDYGRVKVVVDMSNQQDWWHLPFSPVQVFSFDWLEYADDDDSDSDK